MQTISSTFAAYALPGLNDLYNPIDNAAAAIKYIVANYGNPSNTPGVRSIDAGGGYQGYSAGGVITADTGSVVLRPGLNAVMNGTGALSRFRAAVVARAAPSSPPTRMP